jgi:hydrogenase maturation protein HypF
VRFFRVTPQVVACDLHPDYASTRHAETLAAAWGVPLVRVQHHEAHLAACIAENRLEGPVLGLSWDGTGFGPDGTVWGGEVLEYGPGKGDSPPLPERPSACFAQMGTVPFSPFRRLAHLRQFALPGGDRAVRQPRRSALGLLFEILGPEAEKHAAAWFRPGELEVLLESLARPRLNPRTSSMGRLFDAVAALCGLPTEISFEGQAAMALEFAADPECQEAYPLPLVDGSWGRDSGLGIRDWNSNLQSPIPNPQSPIPTAGDWEPMVRAILADVAAGEPVRRISARFHNALADWAVAVARRWGGVQVALTGGCFQNALLTGRTGARLRAAGFRAFTHRQVPPGDGGIALGQVYHVLRNPR